MAKISVNKLSTIKSKPTKTLNINGEEIIVVQYLPMTLKATFVSEFLEMVLDDHGMSSSMRETVYYPLLVIKHYTNINLTDLMLGDNAFKTYDLLLLNNIFDLVMQEIPQEELESLHQMAYRGLEIVSNYRTSIAGLFMDMQMNNADSVKDTQTILQDLNSVADSPLLKSILQDLG